MCVRFNFIQLEKIYHIMGKTPLTFQAYKMHYDLCSSSSMAFIAEAMKALRNPSKRYCQWEIAKWRERKMWKNRILFFTIAQVLFMPWNLPFWPLAKFFSSFGWQPQCTKYIFQHLSVQFRAWQTRIECTKINTVTWVRTEFAGPSLTLSHCLLAPFIHSFSLNFLRD